MADSNPLKRPAETDDLNKKNPKHPRLGKPNPEPESKEWYEPESKKWYKPGHRIDPPKGNNIRYLPIQQFLEYYPLGIDHEHGVVVVFFNSDNEYFAAVRVDKHHRLV
jgi:hypothetical protein